MSTGTVSEIKESNRNVINRLFYAVLGWPQIDIEHAEAVEALKTFMVFGKLFLIHQPNPSADNPIPPTKLFTYLSVSIDLFTLTTVIRFICCLFTDNLLTLAYLGDIFVGMRNEYALRMLGVCSVACLGGFRGASCYLARNGSLGWIKVIDKAMINGWKPEVLNMKDLYCLKWRQTSVFMARQTTGTALVSSLVWIMCFVYLTVNCQTLYVSLQSPLVLICFIFWQLTLLISIIWVIPAVAWIAFLYGVAFFYVINKSNSVYSDLQASLGLKRIRAKALRKLCEQTISFLNEFDYINRMMRYIGYSGYNLVSLAGQVAMLYSYFGLFGIPSADLGLGIIGFNTVFQVGLMSYLAAKSVAKIGRSYSHYHVIYQKNYNIEPRLKLKLLYNMDRLSCPFVGFWVGESISMDNYSFIQYLFETCANMMLIIVTLYTYI